MRGQMIELYLKNLWKPVLNIPGVEKVSWHGTESEMGQKFLIHYSEEDIYSLSGLIYSSDARNFPHIEKEFKNVSDESRRYLNMLDQGEAIIDNLIQFSFGKNVLITGNAYMDSVILSIKREKL
jgi:hypothetical protein